MVLQENVIDLGRYLYQLSRTLSAVETVINGRRATEQILHGTDDRLVVIVG